MHNALKVLSGFDDVHLDDILVFKKSIPKHLEYICSVLHHLRDKKIASQVH